MMIMRKEKSDSFNIPRHEDIAPPFTSDSSVRDGEES
jgi:hypothetical protein